jgi:response regulator RpfG family c-di-GMP phosphodiesterase
MIPRSFKPQRANRDSQISFGFCVLMITKEKILCVDDDPIVIYALQKDLQAHFNVVTAKSGQEALTLVAQKGPFAVIVADMMMPEMNGVQLLMEVERIAPDSVRVMLSGDSDKQTAVDAINDGHIFRFLTKPCAPEKLVAVMNAAVKQHRLIVSERELLEKTLNGSVTLLTELLAGADPEAFGRGQKLRDWVRAVAPVLQLEPTWDIEIGALLAQVGLVTIPPTVLQKYRNGIALRPSEKDVIDRFPEIGAKLLSKIPRLEPAAQIVLYQKQGFDGSGFPSPGLLSSRIPIGARVLRVLSDLLDLEAAGSSRMKAFDQLKRTPKLYDPRVLDAVYSSIVEKPAGGAGTAVSVKQLVPGHELLSTLETLDGMIIAPAGTVLSETMLQRISNFAELIGIREPIHVR